MGTTVCACLGTLGYFKVYLHSLVFISDTKDTTKVTAITLNVSSAAVKNVLKHSSGHALTIYMQQT